MKNHSNFFSTFSLFSLGHRPLYAQFYINDLLINGNSSAGWPGFEKLFYDYGVDVQVRQFFLIK